MNIGIAGAGLAGRMMAWRLLRDGHQVTVFDRDTIEGFASAAKVAAAMLAPFSEAVKSERDVFDWGMQGLDMWPVLLDQLGSDCGCDTPFQREGSMVVAHAADHNNLVHFNQLLQNRVGDYQQSIRFVDLKALQELEPELAINFRRATYLSEEGHLDNWSLLDNLARAIQSLGGQWLTQTKVTDIRARVISVDNNEHHFDWVIDTRGVGAKQQLSDLRAVRGEVLSVKAPEVKLNRPVRLMHPRYQLYIAPKPGNIYVIGATEIESESMKPMTVRSSLELQSALFSVHSGFAEATISHWFANCRPAFMNNLPRIDVSAGLMSINGLHRHGYLLTPVVIDAAMNAFEQRDDSKLVCRH